MFRVLSSVRLVFRLVLSAAVGLIWLFTKEPLFVLIAAGFSVWFLYYLAGFRLEVSGDKIIRVGGNIFKRKTIYMLKTLCFVQTASLHPLLPALIRLQYPGERIFLIGLSGRQAKFLAEIIQKN